MLVCIDKITCARMLQLIQRRWKAKAAKVRAAAETKKTESDLVGDSAVSTKLAEEAEKLSAQADWLEQTIVEIIISEAQNEVKDFEEMGIRHHPAPRGYEEGI